MLFYIKAKVSIKVAGISGFSQEGVSRLVRGDNEIQARQKFEDHCKILFSNMEPEKVLFEYLEIAREIV